MLIKRVLIGSSKEIQLVGKLVFTKIKHKDLESKIVYIFQDKPPHI